MQKLYVWWCFCFILADNFVMTDAQPPTWDKPTCLTFTIDESDKDAGCASVTLLVATSGDSTTVAYSVENVNPSGGGFNIGDDNISGNKKLTCTGSLLTASSYTVTVTASQPSGDGSTASRDLVISVRSGTGPICTQETSLSVDLSDNTACDSVASLTCSSSDCSGVSYSVTSQTPSGGGFDVSGSTFTCSSATANTYTVVVSAQNTGDSETTSISFTIIASGNSDVNECTSDTHNCDTNAICTNTVGSFTCACKPGYSGNGVSCTDVNECTSDTHNCDTNAICTNTVGSFTCACKPGYSGNGVSCTDVNECTSDTHNCDTNAICTNTVGSFTCACKPGYSGNGVSCTDVNECTSDTHNCDTNAICTNTVGSFTCACKPGYSGNGVSCTDVNECTSDTHNCDTNAICTNTVGSFTCACKPGYSGNGVSCTEDCNEPTARDNATIVTSNGNVDGSEATYTCESGYTRTAGAEKLTCTSGSWIGDLPTCSQDCTTDPESADNAQISKTNDNKAGSVATYSCIGGYTRTAGDATRTCTDGTWTGTAPTCSTGPEWTTEDSHKLIKDNIDACDQVTTLVATTTGGSAVTYSIVSQDPQGAEFATKTVENSIVLACTQSGITVTTYVVVVRAKDESNQLTTDLTLTIAVKDINILQRLKDNIKTSMSSVVKNWTSDRAADGNIGPDPDMCQCCSGTENALLSWWMVDFEANIPINRIIVYSRSNEKDFRQLEGFQLNLSDNVIYNVTSFTSTSTHMFSIVYELPLPDILTRYINIQRPGSLTLCEVKVFQGVCELGSFGHECEQRCHCGDNRPCDVDTGYCQLPACKTGWQGQACNEKCRQDTFGEECSEKCYCADGTCSNNYGTCSGKCRSGYRGPHCNEECLKDTFGVECSRKCFCAEGTCTHDNGTCSGKCRSGYRGPHCNEAEESEKENKALIIGVAVGVPVALIVVAVIICVVVYRARHKNRSSGTNVYTKPDVNVTPTETQEYDTLDDVNDVRGSESHGYENERVTGL